MLERNKASSMFSVLAKILDRRALTKFSIKIEMIDLGSGGIIQALDALILQIQDLAFQF